MLPHFSKRSRGNMNSLILLSAVLFTTVLGAPANIHNRDLLVGYAKECKEKSQIGFMALLGVAMLDPPDDDQGYKDYILCYLQKIGFLTPQAEYRDDTSDIVKWLSEKKAKTSLADAKELCGDRKGETPADTASLIFRCFIKNGI